MPAELTVALAILVGLLVCVRVFVVLYRAREAAKDDIVRAGGYARVSKNEESVEYHTQLFSTHEFEYDTSSNTK